MSDYIKKEDAYKTLTSYYHHETIHQHMNLREALDRVPVADDYVPISFHEKCVRYEIEKRIALENALAVEKEKTEFLEYLYNVIQPNQMEHYREMFYGTGVSQCDGS